MPDLHTLHSRTIGTHALVLALLRLIRRRARAAAAFGLRQGSLPL